MVTVIVGSKIAGYQSVVVTTNADVDKPRIKTIHMPNKRMNTNPCKPGKPKWANYIKGAKTKTQISVEIIIPCIILGVIVNYIGEAPTFQAVIVTSVPTGGGLSSSASLEVATYTFLDALRGPNDVL